MPGVVAENHALGRKRLVFEGGSKKYAFVASVGRAGEFAGEGRTDKRARQNLAKGDPSAFHGTNELLLRGGGAKSRRFHPVGMRVIGRVDQGEPFQRSSVRLFFTDTFFRERSGDRLMDGAAWEKEKAQARSKDENASHRFDGLTSGPRYLNGKTVSAAEMPGVGGNSRR